LKQFQNGDIHFSSPDELCKITVEMAGLSRRQLDIVSRSLEPAVYATVDFVDAVKNLVLSARGRVRIIVLDPIPLISRGNHRLVDLAMRLSSFIEIRRPGEYHLEFNEAMLIADRLSVVHRKYSDRYEGMANFQAPRLASTMTENFEAIWQHAETIPHFRRLML
jgi:hypothetical protein